MDRKKFKHIDFSKIENNKKLIDIHLKIFDWTAELIVNCNDANLSSALFLEKIRQLIYFYAPLQRASSKN